MFGGRQPTDWQGPFPGQDYSNWKPQHDALYGGGWDKFADKYANWNPSLQAQAQAQLQAQAEARAKEEAEAKAKAKAEAEAKAKEEAEAEAKAKAEAEAKAKAEAEAKAKEEAEAKAKSKPSRVRYSLVELQTWYENGNKKPLEDLMRAFKGIKEKDPSDPTSFFNLSGYHGLPYRGPGKFNQQTWGGYCNHGNILFPTWHRVYLWKLEEALRSVPGCENVTLPYWDETDSYSMNTGIPWCVTVEKFVLDGEEIDNPLLGYTLQQQLDDLIIADGVDNSKPKGYQTRRGPLSGRVDPPNLQQTKDHNAKFSDHKKNVEILNENVKLWLQLETASKFRSALNAPNYTVFSNQTSADAYNEKQNGMIKVEHLEAPHNDMHAAVGGFPSMGALDNKISQELDGAGGDMGEIDTAAFDPIFYFHHCNVDRMFWVWQKKNNSTESLDIIKGDPGTITRDPMPGIPANTTLNLDSPLVPFQKEEQGFKRFYTSRDCFNIEKQFGYSYSVGSLEQEALAQPPKMKMMLGLAAEKDVEEQKSEEVKKCRVSNIDRTAIKGTFVVGGYLPVPGQADMYLGSVTIFNRWNLEGCSNCQQHLKVKALFDIPNIPGLEDPHPYIRIISHEGSTHKDECVKNNPTCGPNKLLGMQFKLQSSEGTGGKGANNVVRQAQLDIV